MDCFNEETGTWLERLFFKYKIGDKALRALIRGELTECHRVVMHVEKDVSAE